MSRHPSTSEKLHKGSILLMTLVFVSMFVIIFSSLAGLVSRTYHESVLQAQDETAFQIAEAGLNFGRWRLAHAPEDFNAVTREVDDQFAGTLGTYELLFEPPPAGSTTVAIQSIGRTASQPGRTVTLHARYGRPSLARYSSITNGDVWYGGAIAGAVHANGGIRMTGTNDSIMSSAQETYACQPIHGCSSPYEAKPGVWGTGTTQELWKFPVPTVDYNALTLDLLSIREAAQAADTYYGPSGLAGYEIEFNANNTYSIYQVQTLGPAKYSFMPEGGYQYVSVDVGTRQFIETKDVPANGVIYTEDRVWISGDIRDRITVAAGVFPDTPSSNVDIVLNGNITYGGVKDGSRAFAAIAQRNIIIPWSGAPDTMYLDGAYVAQKGSFHRRHYPNCCGSQTHRLKSSLTRYGMLASNGIPGTSWWNSGVVVSGFQTGQASYDSHFLYAPPPYFPTSGQYEFISWEEEQ